MQDKTFAYYQSKGQVFILPIVLLLGGIVLKITWPLKKPIILVLKQLWLGFVTLSAFRLWLGPLRN